MLSSEDGRILISNRPFDELFKDEQGELENEPVEVLIPRDIRGYCPDLRNTSSRLPTKRRMGENRDLWRVTKNGGSIPLELALEPITVDDEKLALVVAIDIRSRKQAEERMRLVQDRAASAVVMIDHSSRIDFVNQTLLDLAGYTEQELRDQSISRLVPEDLRRAHSVYVQSCLHNKSSRAMGKPSSIHLRHKDGTLIPVEIALTPVMNENHELVVCTITDLRESTKAKKPLKAKNQDLSQFTYSASHDLRAPLPTILGLIKICMDDLDDGNIDGIKENSSRILEIAERSAKKVEAILEITRSSRDALTRQDVCVEPEIGHIRTDVTGPSPECSLILDLHHKDPMATERASLCVVLESLPSNAIRYVDTEKETP